VDRARCRRSHEEAAAETDMKSREQSRAHSVNKKDIWQKSHGNEAEYGESDIARS
jgi:hypothetical protein